MESSKLKNIILLILVITNLLLGLLMVVQGVTSRQRQTQTLLDAVELLQDRGISVDVGILPQDDFPPPMSLERDAAWEREMFSALLGDGVTATQRGLVSYYESSLGRAEAREDGSFSAAFPAESFPVGSGDMRTHAISVLARMGLEVRITAESETALEAVQLWNGSPVFSCVINLRYENGSLVQISGSRLMGIPAAEPSQEVPLSVATLLLRFRAGIIDSGDACSAIRSATRGYVLSSAPAGKSRLVPVLCLETDTSLYFVDALSGSLSRG